MVVVDNNRKLTLCILQRIPAVVMAGEVV